MCKPSSICLFLLNTPSHYYESVFLARLHGTRLLVFFADVMKSIESCRTSLATRLFTAHGGAKEAAPSRDINIRLTQKRFRQRGFKRLTQTFWSASPFPRWSFFFVNSRQPPLCCFLQMFLKRPPRVKRFILKSHSLAAEKSAATPLCNTPCISSAAWITCTAAANQIFVRVSSHSGPLADILRENLPCFFFSPRPSLHPQRRSSLFTVISRGAASSYGCREESLKNACMRAQSWP